MNLYLIFLSMYLPIAYGEPDSIAPREVLSTAGIFEDVSELRVLPHFRPYEVNVELWSDCAQKKRWIALPTNTKAVVHPRESWSFPEGTQLVKHFEIETESGNFKRLETRVLTLRQGLWRAKSYRWREDHSDADIVTRQETETISILPGGNPRCGVGQRTWQYPSSQQCANCHRQPTNAPLGMTTKQLNRAVLTVDGQVNQLQAWSNLNLLDPQIHDHSSLPRLSPMDSSDSLSQRARSYLDVNCASCHSPRGGAPGGIDLLFETPIFTTQLIYAFPSEGDLGILGAFRILPRDRSRSILYHRMIRSDQARMPKFGSLWIDAVGAELIGQWIDEGAE